MSQKDAYYFSHDSNAADDPKCMLLIEQLGLEGYGCFWVLVEKLRDQPGYRLPLALLPSLSRRYNTTQQKLETVIRAYGLFELENGEFFFSHSLRRRMAIFESKREQARIAGKKSGKARQAKAQRQLLELSAMGSKERTFNGSSTVVEQVKKSTGEERKGDQSLSGEREGFSTFRSKVIDEYSGRYLVSGAPGYESTTIISISKLGYLKNEVSKKDLTPEDAKKVWEWLYENPGRIGQVRP